MAVSRFCLLLPDRHDRPSSVLFHQKTGVSQFIPVILLHKLLRNREIKAVEKIRYFIIYGHGQCLLLSEKRELRECGSTREGKNPEPCIPIDP